jgi:anti-sigma factor RsiW
MSCRKTRFLIQGYLDGEATPAERSAVEAHVAKCRPCEQELRSSRQLLSVLSGNPDRGVSEGFEHRLMQAIGGRRPAAKPAAWWERFVLHFEWRLRFPAMVTAGTLATAALAGIVFLRVQDFDQARHDRQEYVATAVQRYEQLQRSDSKVNWDAVDASIDLNSGKIVTE